MSVTLSSFHGNNEGDLVLGAFALQLHIVLEAHPRDHLELGFERVDMLLFIFEDFREEIAADIIANGLAVGDRALELLDCLDLQSQVRLEDFLDILADAQKENVYVQSFRREASGWRTTSALTIRLFADWLAHRAADAWVSGPGLLKWRTRLPPEIRVVDEVFWEPRAEGLLPLGSTRLAAGSSDNALSLEPLYLRPSSAEQQWQARGGSSC